MSKDYYEYNRSVKRGCECETEHSLCCCYPSRGVTLGGWDLFLHYVSPEILGRGERGLKFVFTLQGSILRYLGEQIKWDNFIK